MSETEQATQDNDAVETTGETKSQTISVINPTPEEMKTLTENIKVNYNFKVNVRPTQFNFKKSKDKETGIETVREAVVLAVPYPSVEGIVAILEEGGKGLELLQDAIETVINSQARDLLYEDYSLTAATFPVDKCSWDFISKIPKAQRRGGGIPKEIWEAFGQDYVEVMPDATGKTVEQITNAAKILVNKLASVKTNEPVLNLLVEQLAVYAGASPNVEEFEECIAFLLNKADTFLNVKDEELLANL
jgi:hypothetical protein